MNSRSAVTVQLNVHLLAPFGTLEKDASGGSAYMSIGPVGVTPFVTKKNFVSADAADFRFVIDRIDIPKDLRNQGIEMVLIGLLLCYRGPCGLPAMAHEVIAHAEDHRRGDERSRRRATELHLLRALGWTETGGCYGDDGQPRAPDEKHEQVQIHTFELRRCHAFDNELASHMKPPAGVTQATAAQHLHLLPTSHWHDQIHRADDDIHAFGNAIRHLIEVLEGAHKDPAVLDEAARDDVLLKSLTIAPVGKQVQVASTEFECTAQAASKYLRAARAFHAFVPEHEAPALPVAPQPTLKRYFAGRDSSSPEPSKPAAAKRQSTITIRVDHVDAP